MQRKNFSKLKFFIISIIFNFLLNACQTTHFNHNLNSTSSNLLWNLKVGKENQEVDFHLNPTFKDQVIYTSDASGLVTATQANGKIIWRKNLATKLATGPTVDEKIVIVGGQNTKIYALHRDNGQLSWQAELSNEILTAPLSVANAVITVTLDGVVKAFDSKDGHLLWAYQHGSSAVVLRTSNGIKTANGMLIVGFADGQLVNLDVLTGQIHWQKNLVASALENEEDENNALEITPLIINNTIYAATSSGKLVALTLQTGEILWEEEIASAQYLMADTDALYMSDFSGNIWAIDKETGTVLWKQNQLASNILSSPQIIAGKIVVADNRGMIHWLNRQDGSIFKEQAMVHKGKIKSSLLVNQNKIYFLTDQGYLVAYKG